MESFRLSLYVRRMSAMVLAALGALMIISGAEWPAYAALFYPLAVILFIEQPILELVAVYRSRQLIRQENEVTLTSEGIQVRTENYTRRVAWEMVERVDELADHWIFVTKKPLSRTALRKRALTQEQQAELAAFLRASHLGKQVRKGMAPVPGGS